MKIPPHIKTPCPMQWDQMRGDSRRRFCDHCQLHVENLSAMSNRQAADVLRRTKDARVCVTYLQRDDGTMVTRADLFRERLTSPFRRVVSWLLASLVPVALAACSPARPPQPLAGAVGPSHHSPPSGKKASKDEHRTVVLGGI